MRIRRELQGNSLNSEMRRAPRTPGLLGTAHHPGLHPVHCTPSPGSGPLHTINVNTPGLQAAASPSENSLLCPGGFPELPFALSRVCLLIASYRCVPRSFPTRTPRTPGPELSAPSLWEPQWPSLRPHLPRDRLTGWTGQLPTCGAVAEWTTRKRTLLRGQRAWHPGAQRCLQSTEMLQGHLRSQVSCSR